MALIEAVDVLQNTDASTCWSLQCKVGCRVGVDKEVIQILEVKVHGLVQCFWKHGTPWRRPVSKFLDVEAVEKAAEAIQVAPSP